MILTVLMKTPDALDYAIKDAIECLEFPEGTDIEFQKKQLKELCKKWFKWDELVTLEIDTVKETIRVMNV